MKKIILLIALLFLFDSASAQRLYLPGGNYLKDTLGDIGFSSGIRVPATSTFTGVLSLSGSSGILGNNVNISLINGGSYLLDGVNLTALFGGINDTNLWSKTNTFDLLRGTRPIFTGMITGDSLYASAWKVPSFSSWFYDGGNAIDLTSTYIQQSSKNYISFKIDGNTKAMIDGTGIGADSIHGISRNAHIKAGDVNTDSIHLNYKLFAGTNTGTAKINVAGDTLFKFRSSLFNDSSYFMMQTNPFTGSTTLKLFGKTGNNMLTLDSAGITTSLPITSTSSSTSTLSGGLKPLWLEGSSSQYIGLTSKFIMTSATDGKIKLLNYAGNNFTSLTFGLETSAFPMLLRRSNGLALKGGDTASYMDLQLKKLRADTVSASVMDSAGSLYATQNWSKNNLRPYKVYTVLLNQTSTNAPVATILENTLGVTPTWSYEGSGQYKITSTGLFLANKTFIATNYGIASEDFANYYSLVRDNDNELLMVVSTGDDRLINTPIEIRIYN